MAKDGWDAAKLLFKVGGAALDAYNKKTQREHAAAANEAYRKAVAHLNMQARKLEGWWISEEARLQCEVINHLGQADITLTLYDFEGRQRANAEVHLEPTGIGTSYYCGAHKFIASVGLNQGAARNQDGSITIDANADSFTLVLFQQGKGPSGQMTSLETLRATFRPKAKGAVNGA